jgi:uncharacterized repeat protein (TIGR03803 family)
MMNSIVSLATCATLTCTPFFALAAFAPPAGAATESVVYSFQNNGQDGYFPAAALTELGGKLYGTTSEGGIGDCIDGCGTIFSLDPATSSETVLYSFQGTQQVQPGSMLGTGGRLFGTTFAGGQRGAGSLFSFGVQNGEFTTLYSFCNLFNCSDGVDPFSGLLDWKGTIYGTGMGGSFGDGVVFSFNPTTDVETSIYSFCPNFSCLNRVYNPVGGLTRIKREMFGLTELGGKYCNNTIPTCGAVFKINPATGKEATLYEFCRRKNCTDGAGPVGTMIAWKDMLYGVTEYGGNDSCSGVLSCGTVFSINPATGAETVLHAFAGSGDGFGPLAGLVELNGTLYGTTALGGANNAGAVYSVNPTTGAEAVIYSFCSQQNCADGNTPQASLVSVNGTLYGTTLFGGVATCNEVAPYGCGAVFAITP